MVRKGKISAIHDGGAAVNVTPFGGGVVTVKLVVPFFLIGLLSVNTIVAYVAFEDNTGLVIGRADGAGIGGAGGITVSSEGDAIIIESTKEG